MTEAVTHHASAPSHHVTKRPARHHVALRGCLSGGAVIATHGHVLRDIGRRGRLLAPVGRAIYYTDRHHGCIPGKHARRRG
ncbi:hypothetical protein [Acetobacter estunensis]|uniref:hypothetical protein n=1 Tax=Acetobacter estunensis TaxID=104097 RepID=UPI001C2D2888|nr:hypothetical protein [Acetobacter estunensis]